MRHESPYPGPADRPQAVSERPARTVDMTTPRIIVGCAVLLVVVAGLALLGYVAAENQSRAESWKARAGEAQTTLNARTKALNRQTARLNKTARLLRTANRDIKRSEADVASLEARQTELAAEKAAIEDERAQLLSMADSLANCNGAIVESLGWLDTVSGPPAYVLEDVAGFCGRARAQMDTYSNAFE